MKKGTKKSPVTKDELYRQQEMKYKRDFIQQKFFPALEQVTESVDEAGYLLQAITSLIMEEAMETLKSTRIKDIHKRLITKLCPNHEREVAMEHLVSLLDSQTLFEARGNSEGMKAVIEQIKIDEMRAKKLADVKVDWERYLNK